MNFFVQLGHYMSVSCIVGMHDLIWQQQNKSVVNNYQGENTRNAPNDHPQQTHFNDSSGCSVKITAEQKNNFFKNNIAAVNDWSVNIDDNQNRKVSLFVEYFLKIVFWLVKAIKKKVINFFSLMKIYLKKQMIMFLFSNK